MKIVLVGFMGTGKTSVGKLLAQKLGLKFLDTDEIIRKVEGKEIAEIFAEQGEEFFRVKETKVLKKEIMLRDKFVLATGGGIVLAKENRELILTRTKAFLLEATAATIYQRTSKDNNKRPLLEQKDPLKIIKQLLKQRASYYQQFPNKIDTENKTPLQITKEIINKLGVESKCQKYK